MQHKLLPFPEDNVSIHDYKPSLFASWWQKQFLTTKIQKSVNFPKATLNLVEVNCLECILESHKPWRHCIHGIHLHRSPTFLPTANKVSPGSVHVVTSPKSSHALRCPVLPILLPNSSSSPPLCYRFNPISEPVQYKLATKWTNRKWDLLSKATLNIMRRNLLQNVSTSTKCGDLRLNLPHWQPLHE